MAPKSTASNKRTANPRRIVISRKEFSTDVTSLDNVQASVEEFQTHGFVILENAIATDIVDKLRHQMLADSVTSFTFPDLVFNHGNEHNNFSITPPLSDEFMFKDIWANKHATAVMQQIIGPRPLLCWASSNVAIPSGDHARQAVHSDAYADIPNFPFCVEMNIYLQDTTPENGSTEIWPGTHVFTEDDHLPHGRGWIKGKAFNHRARISPPIYPTIPAGSILMRDLRLWHSGMPNTSASPRIIIALLYFPQWFRPHMRLILPASVRPKADAWTHIDLLSNTDFVDGCVDHLRTRFPMNFTQNPTKGLVEYRTAIDRQQGRAPGTVICVTKENYWVPPKYRTRAVGKRGRQADGDNEVEKKMIKLEAEVKQESEVTQGVEARQQQNRVKPSNEQEQKIDLEQEAEAEQEQKNEAKDEITEEELDDTITLEYSNEEVTEMKLRPWLRQGPETTQDPEIQHKAEQECELESKQETSLVEDVSNYKNSLKHAPMWWVKLQEDQNAALEPGAAERQSWDINSGDSNAADLYLHSQYFPKRKLKTTQQLEQENKVEFKHEAERKQDTTVIEDLPDYEDSPVCDAFPHLRKKKAMEKQGESLTLDKQAWKLNFVTYDGSGPGISPQFSPKSEPPKATQKQEPKPMQNPTFERVSRPYARPKPLASPPNAPSRAALPSDRFEKPESGRQLRHNRRAELQRQPQEKERKSKAAERGTTRQDPSGQDGWVSLEGSKEMQWGW